ncbi:hypothetical protein [Psychroflexus halocasei]|uniref:Uncharacterized protein n=1 Tax=Psychroflexus halocasei TaxID=908615 RepID=A0A1H3YI16_9FLAO|nr:hypothetical protein [Psychroflexus halocasei]SEA11216.1 hypothetical protein SAMN05421540_103155 [Psychroflexus halocasei]
MKIVIQIVLTVIIGVLGYYTYKSVYGPVEFNKVKEKRYQEVILKLKDIRDAEMAHREITGKFTGSFDSLVKFLDTAQYVVTQRRDTTFLDEEYKKTYNVDKYIEDVVIDTLGYTSVKDSLFKKTNRYKDMMYVPHTDNKKFELEAGFLQKDNNKIAVFEAKVNKSDILNDLDQDLVVQEKQTVAVDGVNGEYIKVGSMTEVNTSGNWPKNYGDND